MSIAELVMVIGALLIGSPFIAAPAAVFGAYALAKLMEHA